MDNENLNDEIDQVEKIDPLGMAEEFGILLGKDVRYQDETPLNADDPEGPTIGKVVTGIGFGLMHEKRLRKEELAKKTWDSVMGTKLDDYVAIIEDLGFVKVYETDVPRITRGTYRDEDEDKPLDKYFIYVTEDGFVLSFDTYWGQKSVNGGNLYFNWATQGLNRYPYQGSGGPPIPFDIETQKVIEFDDRDWKAVDAFLRVEGNWSVTPGSHDCRDFIRRKVNRLRESGKLISPWVKTGFLWFLHYADTKCLTCSEDEHRCHCEIKFKLDYETINRRRLQEADPKLQLIVGDYDSD